MSFYTNIIKNKDKDVWAAGIALSRLKKLQHNISQFSLNFSSKSYNICHVKNFKILTFSVKSIVRRKTNMSQMKKH